MIRCLECRSANVYLVCKQHRDGKRVSFQVHCEVCGSYSHTLKRGLHELAVESMLAGHRRSAVRDK